MVDAHIPVLVEEILAVFSYPIQVFFDGTLGGGGHARALLDHHPEIITYYGYDRDPIAIEQAHHTLSKYPQIHYRVSLFDQPMSPMDGALLDLGMSTMQLSGRRGFSLLTDDPLDMRMGPDAEHDAAYVVNTFPEGELAKIFYLYGEEVHAKKAARLIVQARHKKKIMTTQALIEALAKGGFVRRGRLHPATKIFQALRICVNRELDVLTSGLEKLVPLLRPQGRIAVISFHSLEDRIIKYFFKEQETNQIGFSVTKKPLIASLEEKRKNPRARSAKLRVFEKR